MAITPDQVEAIIDEEHLIERTGADSSDPYGLQPFIDTAEAFTAEALSGAGIGASLLEQINIWIAAHFYVVSNPMLARQEIGDGEDEYQYKLGLNFQVTTYGQQALVLDYTGTLATINDQKTKHNVSLEWFGSYSTERIGGLSSE